MSRRTRGRTSHTHRHMLVVSRSCAAGTAVEGAGRGGEPTAYRLTATKARADRRRMNAKQTNRFRPPTAHTYIPVTSARTSVHCHDHCHEHCRVPQGTAARLVGPSVRQAGTAAAPKRSAACSYSERRFCRGTGGRPAQPRPTCTRSIGLDPSSSSIMWWSICSQYTCAHGSNGSAALQQRRQQR